MKYFLIILLSLSLIGCASVPVKPYTEPRYGMTKLQMIDLLGKPDSIEIYKKSDQTRVEYYIYVRNYELPEDKVPVCLINNRVVGWGKTYYEDHVSADDTRLK
jgi:hypothetical protein